MEWVEPWQPFDEPSHVEAFEAEFQRRVRAGPLPLRLAPVRIARRPDRDDALFSVEDGSGRVAWVHLTRLGRQERLPWPIARIYDGVAAWVAHQRRGDV